MAKIEGISLAPFKLVVVKSRCGLFHEKNKVM
jgi:hypothetical protein